MMRALIACRTGMGSSMMLKIKVDQVLRENNIEMEVTHDDINAVSTFSGDILITMADLVPEMKGRVKYVIGIENLMDKNEIKTKLLEVFDSEKK